MLVHSTEVDMLVSDVGNVKCVVALYGWMERSWRWMLRVLPYVLGSVKSCEAGIRGLDVERLVYEVSNERKLPSSMGNDIEGETGASNIS